MTAATKKQNSNMKRTRQKCCPSNTVARWRGPSGEAVVLTASGHLWQRERRNWRLRVGAWTAKKVADWAAAAGYVRVGEPGLPPVARPVSRRGLDWLAAGRGIPDVITSARVTRRSKGSRTEVSRAAGPVLAAGEWPGCPTTLSARQAEELGVSSSRLTAAELAARIERYAERAAAGLPLFGG